MHSCVRCSKFSTSASSVAVSSEALYSSKICGSQYKYVKLCYSSKVLNFGNSWYPSCYETPFIKLMLVRIFWKVSITALEMFSVFE